MLRFVSALVLAAVLLASGEASANGRFPASNAVVFSPADEHTVMVRVTFGLLVSHDDAKSWKWVCERAIGFSGLEDPTYVVTKSGAIVAGLFDGLRISRDGGCSWDRVAVDARVFTDLTTRSDGAIIALSSSYDRHSDAGSLYKSQLYISTDDAHTFTPLGARLDDALLGETVDVAPSDPKRIYISAVRGVDGTRKGVVLVSTDSGAHWTERPFELAPKELAPFIAAIDPKRADRVFIRTSALPASPTRLLLTDDAGKAYRKLLDAKGPLQGFALGEDGATLHVGGPDDGLLGGTIEPAAFKQESALKVQCLARNGSTLWACSNEASGFIAGSGSPLTARLHLADIGGPLACPADSLVTKECANDFVKLRNDLGLDDVPKGAGARDAGPIPTKELEVNHPDSVTHSPLVWIVAIAVLVGGVLFARSRRRRA